MLSMDMYKDTGNTLPIYTHLIVITPIYCNHCVCCPPTGTRYVYLYLCWNSVIDCYVVMCLLPYLYSNLMCIPIYKGGYVIKEGVPRG